MTRRSISLRRVLLLKLLFPTSALAAILGVGGALLINRTIEAAHDRVLDGSVRAIAERVTVEEDEIAVDLPAVALRMLETPAPDSVYYRVSYQDKLVTGYADLPGMDVTHIAPGTVGYANLTYLGRPIRLAGLPALVYGKPAPILIEVAETRLARGETERQLYIALAGLEAVLILTAAVFGWFAVERGLSPLAALSREIDARGVDMDVDLRPLDTGRIPDEVMSPVRAINLLFIRLDRAFQLVRDFTANASHQMKTPLASLWVHLRLLQRAGLPQESAMQAIAEIERSALHLERLVTQLIALARADEVAITHEDIHGSRTNLADVAADVIAQLSPIAAQRDVDLEFQAEQGETYVTANADMIHEILLNLVDNAIRYNKAGGRVSVRVSGVGDWRSVEVIDDGPGIAPEMRTRVFDRFYRIPSKDRSSGAGLGLSIARLLAEQNQGTLTLAEGVDGRGLSALLRFPLTATRQPI